MFISLSALAHNWKFLKCPSTFEWLIYGRIFCRIENEGTEHSMKKLTNIMLKETE